MPPTTLKASKASSVSSKPGIPAKPLKGILKRKKTNEDLSKETIAETEVKNKKAKKAGKERPHEEVVAKGKAKETVLEREEGVEGKKAHSKKSKDAKPVPSTEDTSANLKSADTEKERGEKTKDGKADKTSSSVSVALEGTTESKSSSKTSNRKNVTSSQPEKRKRSKLSDSARAVSPLQADEGQESAEKDTNDDEVNADGGDAGADSDSSVLLHGFSSESDSSDEDEDVDGPALDVGKLPTVAKDDASVKRKLEKAKKQPVSIIIILQGLRG